MSVKPKILLATTHWENNSHHSFYSGYQRLVHYLKASFDLTVVTWGVEHKEVRTDNIRVIILKSAGKTFVKKRYIISKYCSDHGEEFEKVFLLYSDIGIRLNSNVHYISAVHNLSSIGRYNSIKERFILWLKSNLIEPNVYRKSSKIICVSENIRGILSSKYGEKVVFIPHGIDIHFWKPQPVLNTKFLALKEKFSTMALCVGINGVDISQVERCIQQFPDTLFCLLGSFEMDYPNVRVFKGISDEDLRDLYTVADVFFRPLTFATANNSLLEAMSMGKEIVITKTGGVTDYVTSNHVCVAKEDNSDFVDNLQQVLQGQIQLPTVENLRNYTINTFSWEVITKKIGSLLR